ncbi:hypothetical protein HED63_21155 [Ochrobactrum cytisi]|nr:hypothetical protein [Brucella cytisi]
MAVDHAILGHTSHAGRFRILANGRRIRFAKDENAGINDRQGLLRGSLPLSHG